MYASLAAAATDVANHLTGVPGYVIAAAALVAALHRLWKSVVKPILRLPNQIEDQVKEWAQVDESRAWQERTDERLDYIETTLTTTALTLTEVADAVNHRGPEGPTLSREHADVAATVKRIADHLGIS